jgi:hypothetical protein
MRNPIVLLLTLILAAYAVQAQTVRRVYVVDHDTWEASSTMILNSGNGSFTAHAGVRRVNTEQITNLAKVCTDITVTNDSSKADFFIVWDTKTWAQTSWTGHQNEFAIYNRTGDLVGAGESHAISGAAKDICKILHQH